MNRFSRSLPVILFMVLAAGLTTFAQQSAEVPRDFLKDARKLHAAVQHRNTSLNVASLQGIDSVVNFVQSFNANGVDANGNPQNLWSFAMVGNSPEQGGTTHISAPVIPVSLNLLNPDGSVFLHYDVTPFIQPSLLSPVFSPTHFSTSAASTQFTDAIQRAEFFSVIDQGWHTLLVSSLKTARTMSVPAGSYRFALNPDGSCCFFVLVDANSFSNLLFPPTFPVDNTTIIGQAELAGDMTTKDITTLLFPNTYLYLNGKVKDCCVLGFHEFDLEPGIPENGNLPRFYVMNYSSWISPGIFGGDFEDVTALSHEMAEIFNDPFVVFDGVHNLTPWWLSGSQCQDAMEVGDVIESLPANVVFPITMNGMTYHPQNEALLPWFEFQSPSTAFQGAYSYPNTQTLPALSQAWNVGCKKLL